MRRIQFSFILSQCCMLVFGLAGFWTAYQGSFSKSSKSVVNSVAHIRKSACFSRLCRDNQGCYLKNHGLCWGIQLWCSLWVVWVRDLPVWEKRLRIVKNQGPRISFSEGLDCVENTGLTGKIAFSPHELGRSAGTRTPGLLLPKQARYQLRNTPI